MNFKKTLEDLTEKRLNDHKLLLELSIGEVTRRKEVDNFSLNCRRREGEKRERGKERGKEEGKKEGGEERESFDNRGYIYI